MRFTLRQLQVFVAIGQAGNVTHAADRIAMSQSAASTALGELERQFGRPLFDRVGKRLQLNELGRSIMPKALEMLDRAVELEGLLAGGEGLGTLRLGASLTIGNYLCPALIDRYLQAHPGADVKLEIGNTSHITSALTGFDLDLALIEGEIADPDLEVSDWLSDELAVFCGPGHPLAAQGKAGIERLLEEKWVVREPGSGTRQTLDRAMTPWWPRWRIGLELEHTEAIKGMVAGGRFIGCVSRLALAEPFATGSLVEIKTPDLDLHRRFYLLANRRKYRTPGIDAFISLARKFAAAL
ncbi:MAG TPA: LysR substrate-binding domain-containing protein [Alphaproteobacteria bacterium]|nr:LysR substrate-binding domain-containing protein [Alphaproteobacteria bacterium]